MNALMQNLKEVNREKYDYTAFLKKFATFGEVMKINDDEFDTVFYTYGLKLYDKMPAYDTAFVFVEDGYNNFDVPSRAIKLILRSEEI